MTDPSKLPDEIRDAIQDYGESCYEVGHRDAGGAASAPVSLETLAKMRAAGDLVRGRP